VLGLACGHHRKPYGNGCGGAAAFSGGHKMAGAFDPAA
jgi:hypothetical protein